MTLSIDSDCWYQFENDGEHKRLVGETGDIIPEDDYFASLERFSLGDTISTDITELVVNSVDFTDGDQIKTFIEPHRAKDIESDQAFVHVNFEVTNIAKQELPLPERSCFTLDYNDGFRFSTDSDKDSVFYKPSTKESCLLHSGGGSNWPIASLAPLETETFDLFIPCAEKVATDPDASYVLYIVLPEENGIHEYAVTVK